MTVSKRRGTVPSVGVAVALSAIGLTTSTFAGVATAAAPSGAPKQAEVTFEARMGDIPPEAYALHCANLPNCTTSGDIDLATEAAVSVQYDRATSSTRGADSLSYVLADGTGRRTVACQGAPSNPYVSTMSVDDTIDGTLAVTDVRAVPGANTLGISLNPAGEHGSEFPLEIATRSEGGCGVPVQEQLQNQSLWYGTFHYAHQDEWQEDGGIKVEGLSWDSEAGAFVRTYERPVTVGYGAAPYTAQESTRIEVKPEFCPGTLNQVASATADGQSLSLDGMRFYAGQVITFPANARVQLSDGSVLELDKGGSWQVDECFEAGARISLVRSVSKFWAEIKKTLSGSEAKFEVRTDRAVAGVRGTRYALSYNKRKQVTRVAVKEGKVSLKGINGAEGKVLIKAGQVGVQKGKKRPKIVKR